MVGAVGRAIIRGPDKDGENASRFSWRAKLPDFSRAPKLRAIYSSYELMPVYLPSQKNMLRHRDVINRIVGQAHSNFNAKLVINDSNNFHAHFTRQFPID